MKEDRASADPSAGPPEAAHGFAVELDARDLGALAALRRDPGVRVRLEGGRAVVSGEGGLTGALARTLLDLPALARKERLAGGLLRPRGRRLPTEREGDRGAPLAGSLALTLGVAALPGEAPAPVPLRLVPGGAPLEAELLETTAAALLRWAERASEARLRPLAFACEGPHAPLDRERRALVLGTPLPPLPGERFHLEGPLAIPAGLALDPPLDGEAIAVLLSLGPRDRAILRADGRLARLAERAFVKLTRSAARESLSPPPEAARG